MLRLQIYIYEEKKMAGNFCLANFFSSKFQFRDRCMLSFAMFWSHDDCCEKFICTDESDEVFILSLGSRISTISNYSRRFSVMEIRGE